jgi:hypothetical protein
MDNLEKWLWNVRKDNKSDLYISPWNMFKLNQEIQEKWEGPDWFDS